MSHPRISSRKVGPCGFQEVIQQYSLHGLFTLTARSGNWLQSNPHSLTIPEQSGLKSRAPDPDRSGGLSQAALGGPWLPWLTRDVPSSPVCCVRQETSTWTAVQMGRISSSSPWDGHPPSVACHSLRPFP